MNETKTKIINGLGIVIVMLVVTTILWISFMKYKYRNVEYIKFGDNPIKLWAVNVDNLNNPLDYIIGREVVGRYSAFTKEVILVDGLTLDKINSSLRHETAHYYYDEKLTTNEKEVIKERYELFCQDPDEFFAYTLEYGEDVNEGFKIIYRNAGER